MSGESAEDAGYGNSDEFRMKPIPVRMAIALAGPAANLIFAFVILFGLYLTGVQEPKTTTVVGEVEAGSAGREGRRQDRRRPPQAGQPARAGLGDLHAGRGHGRRGNPVPLTLRRDGRDTTLTLVPEMNPKFGIALSGITSESRDRGVPGDARQARRRRRPQGRRPPPHRGRREGAVRDRPGRDGQRHPRDAPWTIEVARKGEKIAFQRHPGDGRQALRHRHLPGAGGPHRAGQARRRARPWPRAGRPITATPPWSSAP